MNHCFLNNEFEQFAGFGTFHFFLAQARCYDCAECLVLAENCLDMHKTTLEKKKYERNENRKNVIVLPL